MESFVLSVKMGWRSCLISNPPGIIPASRLEIFPECYPAEVEPSFICHYAQTAFSFLQPDVLYYDVLPVGGTAGVCDRDVCCQRVVITEYGEGATVGRRRHCEQYGVGPGVSDGDGVLEPFAVFYVEDIVVGDGSGGLGLRLDVHAVVAVGPATVAGGWSGWCSVLLAGGVVVRISIVGATEIVV